MRLTCILVVTSIYLRTPYNLTLWEISKTEFRSELVKY